MRNEPIRMGMMPARMGEFILEEIFRPLNLSISKAAEITQVRRATLSNIVNGKARLSPDVALRLEKAFGVSMELLLRMQTAHEVAKARMRADDIDVQRYERPHHLASQQRHVAVEEEYVTDAERDTLEGRCQSMSRS